MEILEVNGLTKIYGNGDNRVTALDHVSFRVKKGEFVAIVGASGSGKSTLMNLIGGIDRPTSGDVVVDGRRIFDMDESALAIFRRRNIGIVYQFYNLIPNLTVVENIMLPCLLDNRKPDAQKLSGILEMTGLSDRQIIFRGSFPAVSNSVFPWEGRSSMPRRLFWLMSRRGILTARRAGKSWSFLRRQTAKKTRP